MKRDANDILPPRGIRDGVAQTTRFTLLINALVSITKLLLGLMGQSQTLVADAVHSFSDCITDAGILVGVRFWSAPADERHPYGHWRLESLITITIGLSLITVATGISLRAWLSMQEANLTPPPWYTLVTALLTLFVKEIMFHWTIRKSREYRSRALEANAWHQRSDALSSLFAVAAIGAAMLFPQQRYIDPLGATFVSLLILMAAIRIIHGAVAELMDESLPPEKLALIEKAVCTVAGVAGVHALRSRRNGPGFFLDLHVLVPGSLTVRKSHDIAETVKQHLIQGEFSISDAVVHIEPDDEPVRPSSD
jgi:cation diffusion facilitator family transporter